MLQERPSVEVEYNHDESVKCLWGTDVDITNSDRVRVCMYVSECEWQKDGRLSSIGVWEEQAQNSDNFYIYIKIYSTQVRMEVDFLKKITAAMRSTIF